MNRSIHARLFAPLLAPLLAGLVILNSAPALARVWEEKVTVTAAPQRTSSHSGEQFAIAVTFTFGEHMHIWPNKPVLPESLADFSPIPTVISADKPPAGVRVFAAATQWPKPQDVEVSFTGSPITIASYSETSTAFVPVALDGSLKPGIINIPITVEYQACNERMCFAPETVTLDVPITIVANDQPTISATGVDFNAFNGAVFAELLRSGASPAGKALPAGAGSTRRDFGVFGIRLEFDTSGFAGLLGVLAVAFVGGFVLNLTPCVLPVIPLKILGLQQAAGTRGRLLLLGAMTFLGVVFAWFTVGLLISLGVIGGISEISSYWWFHLTVATFILVMALGMFGAFSVNVPGFVYAMNPEHNTLRGAFQFGILTAVLATPCVAPLAGAAAAWALTQPGYVPMLICLVMGLGMGVPYFVLTANPEWIRWIPRAGAASILLKQILGMLMLSVAAFFLGNGLLSLVATYPWLAKQLHWWAIAVVGCATGLWLTYRTWQITKHAAPRLVFCVLSLAFVVLPVLWANRQTRAAHQEHLAAEANRKTQQAAGGGLWRDYDNEALNSAIAKGNVVVLDFTAEWCLICKTLEATVLSRDAVHEAFTRPGVDSFRADLTSSAAPGWTRLRELKESGIPLLVIWGPGLSEPWKANAYTVDQVLEVINRAKGGKAEAPAAARPNG